jgi:hypothetical protein
MPGPQNPNEPIDQQKLMEDILKGRLTIAQLAELQKQRRGPRQAGSSTDGSLRTTKPSATRIAADRIEPDRSLPTQPARTRASLGQMAPHRTQRPATTLRSPDAPETPRETGSRRVPAVIPSVRPPSGRHPAPAGSTATPRTPNVSSSNSSAPVGSGQQRTTGGGDKSANAPTMAIGQQIHRILASHRGARTAWLLAEIIGPPVALRPEDNRRF